MSNKINKSLETSLFKVIYSFERDVENYVNRFWRERNITYNGRKIDFDTILDSKDMTNTFKNAMKKCKTEREARRISENFIRDEFLGKKMKKENMTAEMMERSYSEGLNNNKDHIIEKMEKAFGKKFPFKKIIVFLVSQPFCTSYTNVITAYAGKEFWESFFHELNHLMFNYYFRKKLVKKISDNQFLMLMESFTILTNYEEVGYPQDLKLRKYILKNKDLTSEKLIDDIIKKGYLKPEKSNRKEISLGFLDRCSYIFNEIKRKHNEGKKDYFGEE